MTKKKTSIVIEEGLWKEWVLFVVKKRGSARRLSDELEKALRQYLTRHRAKGER